MPRMTMYMASATDEEEEEEEEEKEERRISFHGGINKTTKQKREKKERKEKAKNNLRTIALPKHHLIRRKCLWFRHSAI